MKLFTRYNRINLLATVLVFLLSGISFYFLLRYILIDQIDDDLKIEQREIQTYTAKYQRLPEIIAVKDQHIEYATVDGPTDEKPFRTLQLSGAGEERKEMYRRLLFYIRTGNQWHRVAVSKSLEGTDDLIQSIVIITLVTILLILVLSFLINRFVLKKLWQPFYGTLEVMREFELGKKETPAFPSSNIDEFVLMNDALLHATTRAGEDYQRLKEFTENASHELQTPLAIIQSKLDLLIQGENLQPQQTRSVAAAYEALQRLSRLGQGLLLLTKMENGQYRDTALVNLSQKVKDKISQFEEMAAAKQISVCTTQDEELCITMNPLLADIVLNNLLSNAIKYNAQGGVINIRTCKDGLEICNTAHGGALEPDKLFRRFGKPGLEGEGVGLGLAIVKEAALVSGLHADYRYERQQHCFRLQQS